MPVYAPQNDQGRPLVLVLSGEAGWRSFDEMLAGFLRREGFWVGGVDCMKYFWRPQDDRKALASDVRIYADALARRSGHPEDSEIILAGFSFGADLAPWIAGAEGWGNRIAGLVMIGPDEEGSLEFRVTELMGFSSKDHIFRVADVLGSARGIPLLFLHGSGDSSSAAVLLARNAPEPRKLLTVSGANHHFSGRELQLRSALIEGLQWMLDPAHRERPAAEGSR
ncbi:MAG TPA: AcvB/VirJ family lysyl-phosphatidylglycerol hydrolase [Candidatus Polarisedimenticolia bacterium]|nr:AcvB/VirJ family lysyl-phosphatidylglycerol hydrolase [Candidatus Polarisedimenticolia bacterium]